MEQEKELTTVQRLQNTLDEFEKRIEEFRKKNPTSDDDSPESLRDEELADFFWEAAYIVNQAQLVASLKDVKTLSYTDVEVIKPVEMFGRYKQGDLVKIKPCAEEYAGKTYMGFYLGDIAQSSGAKIINNVIELSLGGHNPGIFVPEIGKIIYGYESWWGGIKSEEEFKEITDADIENVWYVKLWKARHMPKETTENILNSSEAAV